VYCTVGCRRAAEHELRRLDGAVARAEGEVQSLRRRVEIEGHVPPGWPKALEWWQAELLRLERRLAELLDDPDEAEESA
jgi:hypothetical protein